MNNYPYVYKITHKVTNEFYIGYRTANEVSSQLDLGIYYKTSSKSILNIGFDKFNIQIIAEFIDNDRILAGNAAYNLEQQLIKENILNPLCLNQHFIDPETNKSAFRRLGPLSETTKEKIKRTKNTPENKLKSSISHIGKKHSETTKLKMSNNNVGFIGRSHTNDSRQKMMGARDTMRNRILTDEHKLNIKLNHIGMTGKSQTEETKLKISLGNKGKIMSDEAKAKMKAAWIIRRSKQK